MRAVRFTKAEVEVLRRVLWLWGATPADVRAAKSVLAKLDAAEREAPAGVAAGPLEQALVASSRGKVVPMEGKGWYGRASKLATAVGATPGDAQVLGAWLARQGWFAGPTTVMTVLSKWGEWLARAKATAPPPGAREGFDGGADAVADRAPRPSGRDRGRGSAPGFG